MKVAIILFAYDRPHYLKKAIKSHRFNELAYAFIDKSDKQDEVFDIINNENIYFRIVKRRRHYGLNNNIISGISEVLRVFDAVIVLEDDLIISRDAIAYLTNQLKLYKDNKKCFAVSLSKGDGNTFKCWGWGIWKDRRNKIDWTVNPGGKNSDSWDMILNENMKRKKMFCKCSDKNRVKHIGIKGTHYSYKDLFSVRRWFRKLRELTY